MSACRLDQTAGIAMWQLKLHFLLDATPQMKRLFSQGLRSLGRPDEFGTGWRVTTGASIGSWVLGRRVAATRPTRPRWLGRLLTLVRISACGKSLISHFLLMISRYSLGLLAKREQLLAGIAILRGGNAAAIRNERTDKSIRPIASSYSQSCCLPESTSAGVGDSNSC